MKRFILIVLLIVYIHIGIKHSNCKDNEYDFSITRANIGTLQLCDQLKNSTEFLKTKISPTLFTHINTNENLIFCSSFQANWNNICQNYSHGTCEIENPPEYISQLNRWYQITSDFDDDTFIIAIGTIREKIINKINHLLNTKLYTKQNLYLNSSSENEIVAFSYFIKSWNNTTKFPIIQSKLIHFNNKDHKLTCLGLRNRSQIQKYNNEFDILYHRSSSTMGLPEGSIIKLITNSATDEIIISSLPVQNNLFSTFNNIEILRHTFDCKNLYYKSLASILILPAININIFNCTDLFINNIQNHLNSNKVITKCSIIQAISFRIEGAVLKQNCFYRKFKKIQPSDFDKIKLLIKPPFIIYAKKTNADIPYFMAYINNEEVLVLPSELATCDINNGPSKDKLFLGFIDLSDIIEGKPDEIYYGQEHLINKFNNSSLVYLNLINNEASKNIKLHFKINLDLDDLTTEYDDYQLDKDLSKLVFKNVFKNIDKNLEQHLVQ